MVVREEKQHDWPSTQISLLDRVRGMNSGMAWPEFVALYEPLIFRYCRRRGLQEADAQDVTQNVFCRLKQALPNFEYDRTKGRFRGWLGTIAFREIRHYKKRAAAAGRGVGGEQSDEALMRFTGEQESEWVEVFNAHVLRTSLERVRSQFDAETWEVFELIWLRDVSPAEVAAQKDRKPAWVYKAKFRVLQRLRQEVAYLAEDAAALHSKST